jgi:hypothetical protein
MPKKNRVTKKKDRHSTECPVDPEKIEPFLVDVSKIPVFPNNNNLPIPIYPSTAYGWRNYLVWILNSISGKAWDFTSLFTSLSRTRIRAISKQVQKAIDSKQSLDNAIITPEPVTTLLQQHIMSTLAKLNDPTFLELHLAVGSEVSESSIRYVLNKNNFSLKVPSAVDRSDDPICCAKRFEYSQLAIQYMDNPNLFLVYIDETHIKPGDIHKARRISTRGFVSKSQKRALLQIPHPST